MLYINDPKKTFKTYDEVVAFAIGHGVEPKRVYIYLAALGVKSAWLRAIDESGVDYLPAVKAAIKGGEVVSKVSACKGCGGVRVQ